MQSVASLSVFSGGSGNNNPTKKRKQNSLRARLTTINTPYEMYYGDSLSLVDRICYERTEVAALLWRINIVALEENRSDSSGEKSPNEPNKPKLSCRDMFKMATTHISYWHRYLNKYISNPDDQLEQSELPPKMTNTQKRSSCLGANALLKLPDKKARSQDHSFEVPKGSSRQIADQSSNGPRSNPNEPAQQPQKESPYSKAQTLHRSSSPMISQQVEPMRKLSMNFLFEEFFYYLSNFSTLRGLWEARQGNKWIAEKHLLNSVMITNKFDYSINPTLLRQRFKSVLALASFYLFTDRVSLCVKLARPLLDQVPQMLRTCTKKTAESKALQLLVRLLYLLGTASLRQGYIGECIESLLFAKKLTSEARGVYCGDELTNKVRQDLEDMVKSVHGKMFDEMRQFERIVFLVASKNYPNIRSDYYAATIGSKHSKISQLNSKDSVFDLQAQLISLKRNLPARMEAMWLHKQSTMDQLAKETGSTSPYSPSKRLENSSRNLEQSKTVRIARLKSSLTIELPSNIGRPDPKQSQTAVGKDSRSVISTTAPFGRSEFPHPSTSTLNGPSRIMNGGISVLKQEGSMSSRILGESHLGTKSQTRFQIQRSSSRVLGLKLSDRGETVNENDTMFARSDRHYEPSNLGEFTQKDVKTTSLRNLHSSTAKAETSQDFKACFLTKLRKGILKPKLTDPLLFEARSNTKRDSFQADLEHQNQTQPVHDVAQDLKRKKTSLRARSVSSKKQRAVMADAPINSFFKTQVEEGLQLSKEEKKVLRGAQSERELDEKQLNLKEFHFHKKFLKFYKQEYRARTEAEKNWRDVCLDDMMLSNKLDVAQKKELEAKHKREQLEDLGSMSRNSKSSLFTSFPEQRIPPSKELVNYSGHISTLMQPGTFRFSRCLEDPTKPITERLFQAMMRHPNTFKLNYIAQQRSKLFASPTAQPENNTRILALEKAASELQHRELCQRTRGFIKDRMDACKIENRHLDKYPQNLVEVIHPKKIIPGMPHRVPAFVNSAGDLLKGTLRNRPSRSKVKAGAALKAWMG